MRLLGITILIFITSCDSGVKPEHGLMYQWNWLGSSGGFAGQTITPASTGDKIIIEFTSKKYLKYVNGQLEEEVRYSIKEGESIFSTQKTNIIELRSGWRQSYKISGDTLFLADECFDCSGHVYVRK